jgi:hypothetical protein
MEPFTFSMKSLRIDNRIICWMCPKCAHVKKFARLLDPKDESRCICKKALYKWHPEVCPEGTIFIWDEIEYVSAFQKGTKFVVVLVRCNTCRKDTRVMTWRSKEISRVCPDCGGTDIKARWGFELEDGIIPVVDERPR